jgi:tetratricopeptide (TPR) repeat protein
MKTVHGLITSAILCIVFLLISAPQTYALFPNEVNGSRDPELSEKLTDIIGGRWFQRKAEILAGEDPVGTRNLNAIYDAQLDRGIRNIHILSSLLLRESLSALRRKDFERAESLCQYAKQYAPDYPPTYFTMARIHWGQSKFRITPVAREWVQGVYATLRNFRIVFFKSLNLIYLFSSALLLTFIVFTIATALKHLSLYVYDLRKKFDLTPVKLLLGVGKALAFIVPVVLKFDLLWTLLYWNILLWGYMARREKQMLVVFLLILVYVPWILDETVEFLEKPDPTVLMRLEEANRGSWNREVEEGFQKWGQERPGDSDVLFTLGLLSKREGNYKKAERYYEDALDIDPEWAECISNLGNVYLCTGKVEDAIEQYERAITFSPQGWAYYFNLHRATSRDSILSSERGGEALDTANRLNSERVAFHTRIYSDHVNRSMVDEIISVQRLWRRVLIFFQARYYSPATLFKAWTRDVSLVYGFIYPVHFLALLCLISVLCSRVNFPKRCPMCGTPSVKFLPSRIQGDAICFACNRLFVRKDSIDPKMKEKKSKQVKGYGKRKALFRTVFSFVIPGGGHLWKGQSVKGSIFVFIFFVLGLKFFYWEGIVSDPLDLANAPGLWTQGGFLVFFLVYYIAVLRSFFIIQSRRSLIDGPRGIPHRL